MTWRNWSGNVECDPKIVTPGDPGDVVDAVESADELRMAGSGHSFSPLVASDDVLLLSDRLDSIDVDGDGLSATVEAGVSLKQLSEAAAGRDLALENLGDVDRQTVVGATATGTHGTGEYPVLSNMVSGLELVTADGERRWLEIGDHGFDYSRLSLGSLGVVTEVEVGLVKDYGLRMERRRIPLDRCVEGFLENVKRYRNYEFFWFPYTDVAVSKASVEAEVEGGRRRTGLLENAAWRGLCELSTRVDSKPLAKLASKAVRPKTKTGRARFVYPEPRDVRFLETEYAVPVEELSDCFHEIRRVVERHDTLFPVEVRYVEADSIPLSPAFGRDSAFVAVHRYHGRDHVDLFRECEEVFQRYDGRPHWGKLHSASTERLKQLYPGFEGFLEYRQEVDPEGVFLNRYLRQLFGVRP